jgi:hypothetical protein
VQAGPPRGSRRLPPRLWRCGAAALRRCVAEEKREARADCEEDRREDRAEFRAEYGGTGKAAFTRCVKDELR